MPGGGIEPPRAEARRILSPLRLPVPPSRLGCKSLRLELNSVFSRCHLHRDDGSSVKDFRDAWWKACIRSGLGRFQYRECEQVVSEGRKCEMCHSKKKAKYVGLHFHDLRRTG